MQVDICFIILCSCNLRLAASKRIGAEQILIRVLQLINANCSLDLKSPIDHSNRRQRRLIIDIGGCLFVPLLGMELAKVFIRANAELLLFKWNRNSLLIRSTLNDPEFHCN